METLWLQKSTNSAQGEISICGSKSESNRILILNHLFEQVIEIQNLSDAEDTQLLQKALHSQENEIDIHHAGTAMRFLTAYFSIQKHKKIKLTGSERMKQRPIEILVDALNQLGVEIAYLENEKFPPIEILGKEISQNKIQLDANISSQYITALMLIAPKLPNGLTIELIGKITSLPYILMTENLMKQIGMMVEFNQNKISIQPQNSIQPQTFVVESDWSSASYFYAMAALSENPEIKINSFKKNSLQGDSQLIQIYKTYFGIETEFIDNQIILTKNQEFVPIDFTLDLNQTPDLAQTIAVTCAGLKIACKLTGLETLKIKETDRLTALQIELFKVGCVCEISENSLEIIYFISPQNRPQIETYNDHRMAMAFATLHKKMDLEILNPSVVNKSYPHFWEDLHKLSFTKK